ncbi:protein FAM199X-like isoform X2 [Dreissena polymorpha]|uniref:protein FAM199X-like isoform X2 n=1 Tax=Dreissena polymorpha TaxID=45954 RepID=UPI00226516A9|nr:protein FAM199X-like isoform X2 [Dreissena polymorpha]
MSTRTKYFPWSPDVLLTRDNTWPVADDSDEESLDLWNVGSRLSDEAVNVACSECSSEDMQGEDDVFPVDVQFSHCLNSLESDLNDLIDSTAMVNVGWTDWDISMTCSSNNINNSSSTCSSPTSINSSSSGGGGTLSDWSPSYMPVPEASQAFTCTTLATSCKTKSKSSRHPVCQKWKNMSDNERFKLIDELSLTISHQLEFREQMEIIKIIDPAANLNKHRTEFVIDLYAIDEGKLRRIQDLVNLHCDPSDHLGATNTHNSNTPCKGSKRSKSQDRRPKVARQRTQKEYRQKLKERRSGLFVQEERLAVSTAIMEEEIDVLG